jgi:hypothetical protein
MTRATSLTFGWILAAYAILRAVRERPTTTIRHTIYLDGRQIARAVQRASVDLAARR